MTTMAGIRAGPRTPEIRPWSAMLANVDIQANGSAYSPPSAARSRAGSASRYSGLRFHAGIGGSCSGRGA
jgi:hypothetical protein